MQADFVEFRRGVVAPLECIKEGWALIKEQYWLFFGINLGLYAGTKYLALVYAPIFLTLVLARRPQRAMLWALPGVIVFALPWYLRNWLLYGDPLAWQIWQVLAGVGRPPPNLAQFLSDMLD